jgi:hypothetical protein
MPLPVPIGVKRKNKERKMGSENFIITGES